MAASAKTLSSPVRNPARGVSRLVLLSTVTAMVISNIAWLWARANQRRYVVQEHTRGEQVLAETGAGKIAAILEGFSSDLDRLSRVASVRYLQDPERLGRTLRSFLSRTPIDSVTLVRVDTTGRIDFAWPANSIPPHVLATLGESGFLERPARSRARFLAGPVPWSGHSSLLAISDLILPDGGPELGAIIGIVPISALSRPLDELMNQGNRSVVVKSSEGTTLYRSERGPPPSESDYVARAAVPTEMVPSLELELRTTEAYATTPLRESRGSALLLLCLMNALLATAGAFMLRELRLRTRLNESMQGRRELEDRLQNAQRLEALGQLAGAVAHDFNNILTVVAGRARLLEERLPHDPSVCSETDAILRASDHAAGLTRQLLSFARRQILEPQLLDLNAKLRDMEPVLRRCLAENMSLSIQIDSQRPWISFDPVQLEQIILNLVSNARDAMTTNGGEVRLSTDDVTVVDREHDNELAPGSYVRLRVADTGHGIPPEALPRIFEPFFTTKYGRGGTGLGLATVHGIVQQSGARIDVRSEVGAGTCFIISIPSATAPPKACVDDGLQQGFESRWSIARCHAVNVERG